MLDGHDVECHQIFKYLPHHRLDFRLSDIAHSSTLCNNEMLSDYCRQTETCEDDSNFKSYLSKLLMNKNR